MVFEAEQSLRQRTSDLEDAKKRRKAQEDVLALLISKQERYEAAINMVAAFSKEPAAASLDLQSLE